MPLGMILNSDGGRLGKVVMVVGRVNGKLLHAKNLDDSIAPTPSDTNCLPGCKNLPSHALLAWVPDSGAILGLCRHTPES